MPLKLDSMKRTGGGGGTTLGQPPSKFMKFSISSLTAPDNNNGSNARITDSPSEDIKLGGFKGERSNESH